MPLILSLQSPSGKIRKVAGSKAAAIAEMSGQGIRVPKGVCVAADAYQTFVSQTGIRERIVMELGRKPFEEMRWEEMWDASLRIRNLFLTAPFPPELNSALRKALQGHFDRVPVAVRSSSLLEDTQGTSFAGLHESFLNLRTIDEIMTHVVLVWASLWSDAALLYRQELGLDIRSSAMAVIIQEMIEGESSGVAFGVSPEDSTHAVIEAVYGLNKGLVDGDVEPDRWILDRATGRIISHIASSRDSMVVADTRGTRMEKRPGDQSNRPPLDEGQISGIFRTVKQLEGLFHAPQDMEWTIRGNELWVLQARPITTSTQKGEGDNRSWYLSLRRSFNNLKALGERIEGTILPAMDEEADRLRKVALEPLSDQDLAEEIKRRKKVYVHWKGVYWEECIPFAHGARLLGQIYNDRVRPDDPYEFMDILVSEAMKSMERNRRLEEMASRVRELFPDGGEASEIRDEALVRDIDSFVRAFSGQACALVDCEDERRAIARLLVEMARHESLKETKPPRQKAALVEGFLNSFRPDERAYALELIDLGRRSYRLRDDDNIYLGRIEFQLDRAMKEAHKRLGDRCRDAAACRSEEEIVRALNDRTYVPKGIRPQADKKGEVPVKARQLRGQPAGQGIARGRARVIHETSELFAFKSGEILVCDAIDPNMTFIVPLASAIVERRGGMLIHGAIIAREYGLPCVTGIPDATVLIHAGDEITVDGYLGLVTIHTGTFGEPDDGTK
ncbi:MAG: PEP/pyruvate-binding domain-containing protein [bacterium]